MSYNPGTHLLATLYTEQHGPLDQYAAFRQLVDELVQEFRLQKLGEVYHNFQPSGFTGVVCLSESHLSVHTWPEHGRVNVDIYLSNYLRSNDDTVCRIYETLKKHFGATTVNEQFLKR